MENSVTTGLFLFEQEVSTGFWSYIRLAQADHHLLFYSHRLLEPKLSVWTPLVNTGYALQLAAKKKIFFIGWHLYPEWITVNNIKMFVLLLRRQKG